MKTLLLELITIIIFFPLRFVSRIFGRRPNAKVRVWQDEMWIWAMGGIVIGHMVSDQYIGGGDQGQAVAGYDHGHHGHHDGGHGGDFGGGFDGGGFGGDVGSF